MKRKWRVRQHLRVGHPLRVGQPLRVGRPSRGGQPLRKQPNSKNSNRGTQALIFLPKNPINF
ncbi:hypothetical protein T492DRAFT_55030 [Pavlovales sp. CCMP2436]|nr:hypothetical protein T492DRAFT_55030 [Pavlovales sp. CCMP2436]